MGLFGTKNNDRPINIDLTTILIMIVMTLVLVQAIAMIVGGMWGNSVKLGPVFVLIAIGMAAMMSAAMFKKINNNEFISEKDIFAVLLTTGIALLLMFFLKKLVPEVFIQGIVEMQSMLRL